MHLIDEILLRLLGLPSNFESTHTHTAHTHSHRKLVSQSNVYNEAKHSKVLRMHFFLFRLRISFLSLYAFNDSMRRCTGNECAVILFSRCRSASAIIDCIVRAGTRRCACNAAGWIWIRFVYSVFEIFYSPFKSFVNCDRVDMIACTLLFFFFVFFFFLSSAVASQNPLAPANECNQFLVVFFLLHSFSTP